MDNKAILPINVTPQQLKDAAVASTKIALSDYWYSIGMRQLMQDRAVKLGIVFG